MSHDSMVEDGECDRCGQCCFVFNQREKFIKYRQNELETLFQTNSKGNSEKIEDTYTISADTLFKIFKILSQQEKFIEKEDSTSKFYVRVPTKGNLKDSQLVDESSELIKIYIRELPKQWQETLQKLEKDSPQAAECMFLVWESSIEPSSPTEYFTPYISYFRTSDNFLPSCSIHNLKPQMCIDYPTSKGSVCLNHPERKYTHEFYQYQQQKIGFVIQVVVELYKNKIPSINPVGQHILTLLMDFGKFSLGKVKNFLATMLSTNILKIENAIQELYDLNLVDLNVELDWIEGISFAEVNNLLDKIMKEKGWDFQPTK